MPTLVNVYEIKVHGQVADPGQPIEPIHNVFHYSIGATTSTPPSPQDVWTAFDATVMNQVCAVTTTDYKLVEGTVRLMDQTINAEQVFPSVRVGAVSPPRLPTFCSVLVQLKTQYRGKSFHGRKFFAPIPEIHVTNDELNAAGETAWANVSGACGVTLAVTGFQLAPVVLAKSKSQLQRDPVVMIGAPVTASLLVKSISTFRKRREKVPR